MSITIKNCRNGIRQMGLPCVSSNQNQIPTLGVKKKFGPKRRGKQGELARTHTCLKVHQRLVGNGG